MTRTIILVSVVAVLLVILAIADYYGYRNSVVLNKEVAVYEVVKGDSLRKISESLEFKKIINKPLFFLVLAYEKGWAGKIKYGEYEITPGMSVENVLMLLVSGKTRQYAVTIVEGLRASEILEALSLNPELVHTIPEDNPLVDVMGKLDAPGENPEGRFFPDTYFFRKGTKDIDILKRAYKKMQVVLDFEWQQRSNQVALSSPYEALTLASIIEKETAQLDERPIIAGVFNRRLMRGMMLQTDPTVIYGLGESFSGNLSHENLAFNTPYNTYLHSGLPPTPISVPSSSSIRAALHPTDGDALYFVSKGNGFHVFSNSLNSHREAVNQYQKPH